MWAVNEYRFSLFMLVCELIDEGLPMRSESFNGFLYGHAVLVCLAVAVGVAVSQDDYDHFFSGPNPGSGPSIPSTPSGGPVLFPNSPAGDETSGVIVGASGYGFVPPRNSIGGVPHYGSFSSGPSYGGFF
ncbi:uncharacterized protein LOC110838036 isoform X2 [Zootermopsis nevadensis]|uniref:uncharacterized protein LOC110838036 isoform X2 n=1 Tax=Zootermopsis nevadensis TaxID=136037 RepID=UPI000B8E8333|nr:uncharacterized protein LOC110838036 isoform X2 [Zootermopsis nevadensis]